MKKEDIEAIKKYVQESITLGFLIHLADDHSGRWPSERFDKYDALDKALDDRAEKEKTK